MDPRLTRALKQFDALGFVLKHGGYKETPSIYTYEYLLPCPRPGCGSDRLRWNARKGTFICWGCKLTGDTIYLVQAMEKIDEPGAIDFIMDGYVGGDAKIDKLEGLTPLTAEQQRHVKAKPLREIPWPHGVELLSSPCAPHERAWGYLRGRGVPEPSVRHWRLGFGRSGRLGNYVVFPCYIDKKLVYYQGRATWDPPAHLSPEQRKAWEKETGYRKTLNPISQEGLATAGEVLLNYDQARSQTHIVIVEGPFDAIKVGGHAVALLGKVMTPQKLDRLMRSRATRYTVYLDIGKEEQEAAEKMAAQLSAFGEVFVATPPKGFDAGALTPDQNRWVIERARRWRPGRLSSFLQG